VDNPDLGVFTGKLRSLFLAANKDRQLPVGMGLVNGVEAVTANVSSCSCPSGCQPSIQSGTWGTYKKTLGAILSVCSKYGLYTQVYKSKKAVQVIEERRGYYIMAAFKSKVEPHRKTVNRSGGGDSPRVLVISELNDGGIYGMMVNSGTCYCCAAHSLINGACEISHNIHKSIRDNHDNHIQNFTKITD